MKRCGKSAPRPEQSGWQGKPHVEQDQIGEEERPAPLQLPGRSLEPARDGGPRGMVAAHESGAQKPAYRSRRLKFEVRVHVLLLTRIDPLPREIFVVASVDEGIDRSVLISVKEDSPFDTGPKEEVWAFG